MQRARNRNQHLEAGTGATALGECLCMGSPAGMRIARQWITDTGWNRLVRARAWQVLGAKELSTRMGSRRSSSVSVAGLVVEGSRGNQSRERIAIQYNCTVFEDV